MRRLCLLVVVLAGLSAAQAAPGQEVMIGLKACRAQTDATARLACFDALVSKLDAPAVAFVPTSPPPPAQTVSATPPAFGGENLVHATGAPRPDETMSAGVAKFSFNAIKHFTVMLDNGQVWRQADSDTAVARFSDSKPNVVKISKGFMDAYSLVIEGGWGTYKVKRIK